MTISYKRDLHDVDWDEMKATLAADDFDNGRTPAQLRDSFANSYGTCIAYADGRIIGTARVLSDGICNAYMVDVWALSEYRRRGVARTMIAALLDDLKGQHVYLFTDDAQDFYKRLGFVERGTGLEIVVGDWLNNE